MGLSEHTKQIRRVYASVKVYKRPQNDWVYLTPSDMGDIKYSCKENDHGGWLLCDGRSVSREEYSELFEAIGTAFGSISGSTFNLPDARGRVLGAIGSGPGLTTRSLGDTVGAETHTLTTGEMPSHNHGVTDPGHTHSYVNNVNNQNTDNAFATETAADQEEYNQTTGSSTTGITINNNGGGGAHNNMQPTEFIGNVFIFAKYVDYNNEVSL
jgi:microcystin-dependent protein